VLRAGGRSRRHQHGGPEDGASSIAAAKPALHGVGIALAVNGRIALASGG